MGCKIKKLAYYDLKARNIIFRAFFIFRHPSLHRAGSIFDSNRTQIYMQNKLSFIAFLKK